MSLFKYLYKSGPKSSGYTFPNIVVSLLILHTRKHLSSCILKIRYQCCYFFKLYNLYYVNRESYQNHSIIQLTANQKSNRALNLNHLHLDLLKCF